jgi:hypothetical protein
VRTDAHTSRSIFWKEEFEAGERSLDEGMKEFFKLFRESTFKGSRATALDMKDIAKRQTKHTQHFLLLHSMCHLVLSFKSDMHSWPNSPLLVLLQIVDPSVLLGNEGTSDTPLHCLALLADPFEK